MVITKVFTDTKKKNNLSNPQRAERSPGRGQGAPGFGCVRGSEQPRGQDCLSEGMQRSSAPKLCSDQAGVSGVSPQHARSSGPCYNPRLTGSHSALGPPTPLRAQDQGRPEQDSTSPISVCGCHQSWTGLPSPFLGHQGRCQSHSSDSPVVVPQSGGCFQPRQRGGGSTSCRFGSDTQESAFLILVNGTKTLPQIINSSPKSSALVTAIGAFTVSVDELKPFPPAGITRLVAKIISSGQRLCFIWPEKGLLLS